MQFNVAEVVSYWETTANRDIETAQSLFDSKRYPEALFFGHLALEKKFKALVVERLQESAPYTHELVKLAHLAEAQLTEEEIDYLDVVTDFNIQTRYPEWKLEFYKTCTQAYTEEHLARINALFQKLCQTQKK